MRHIPEIPADFTAINESFHFTPIATEPEALDLEELLRFNGDAGITEEELDTIALWATMYEGIPEDKLPAHFYNSVRLLGRMWTGEGNENGYFDAVRNLYAFLPEDADISGSDEWKAIEFMYYSCQMALGGNHVFAMMMESSTFANTEPIAA